MAYLQVDFNDLEIVSDDCVFSRLHMEIGMDTYYNLGYDISGVCD